MVVHTVDTIAICVEKRPMKRVRKEERARLSDLRGQKQAAHRALRRLQNKRPDQTKRDFRQEGLKRARAQTIPP